jgi:hypothetical protein
MAISAFTGNKHCFSIHHLGRSLLPGLLFFAGGLKSYSDPLYLRHLPGGIAYAMGKSNKH